MAYSKEQLSELLDPNLSTTKCAPLEKGVPYIGRNVPDEYFVIQDWILEQPAAPEDSDIPDLGCVLQGLEYIFCDASDTYPHIPRDEKNLRTTMGYLNRELEFEGGALRQYPELQRLIREGLLQMPRGQEVISVIQGIEGCEDLFREEIRGHLGMSLEDHREMGSGGSGFEYLIEGEVQPDIPYGEQMTDGALEQFYRYQLRGVRTVVELPSEQRKKLEGMKGVFLRFKADLDYLESRGVDISEARELFENNEF